MTIDDPTSHQGPDDADDARELFDWIDETVEAVTDEQIEDRLQQLLAQQFLAHDGMSRTSDIPADLVNVIVEQIGGGTGDLECMSQLARAELAEAQQQVAMAYRRRDSALESAFAAEMRADRATHRAAAAEEAADAYVDVALERGQEITDQAHEAARQIVAAAEERAAIIVADAEHRAGQLMAEHHRLLPTAGAGAVLGHPALSPGSRADMRTAQVSRRRVSGWSLSGSVVNSFIILRVLSVPSPDGRLLAVLDGCTTARPRWGSQPSGLAAPGMAGADLAEPTYEQLELSIPAAPSVLFVAGQDGVEGRVCVVIGHFRQAFLEAYEADSGLDAENLELSTFDVGHGFRREVMAARCVGFDTGSFANHTVISPTPVMEIMLSDVDCSSIWSSDGAQKPVGELGQALTAPD